MLLLGGNIWILTHLVSPRSLFFLFLFAVVAYGAGCLLQHRKNGWLLGGVLVLIITFFAVRNIDWLELAKYWMIFQFCT